MRSVFRKHGHKRVDINADADHFETLLSTFRGDLAVSAYKQTLSSTKVRETEERVRTENSSRLANFLARGQNLGNRSFMRLAARLDAKREREIKWPV
jgi:hypothetical protein